MYFSAELPSLRPALFELLIPPCADQSRMNGLTKAYPKHNRLRRASRKLVWLDHVLRPDVQGDACMAKMQKQSLVSSSVQKS